MDKKLNIKYILLILIIYIFIYQELLQSYVPIFSYFDELLALISLPVILKNIIDAKGIINFKKNNTKLFFWLIVILVDGLLSNVIYRYQKILFVLSDVILVFKFFLVYYLAKNTYDNSFVDKHKDGISFHIKLNIFVLFVLSVFNYLFHIWPYSYRFGIMSNSLFYSHPTYLAAVCIYLFAFLMLLSDSIKKNIIQYIILIFILISTLRLKAISTAIVVIIMAIYVLITKKKLNIAKIFIIAIFAIIIAFDQVNYYYIELDGSARKQLTNKSVEILKDYFPVGTGFGTYASYMSTKNYSPVYYKYNLNNIYGLEKDHAIFVSDTFWPMILGQFGFLGLISYLICLYIIYSEIQKDFNRKNMLLYISKLVCMGYLII